MDNKISFGSDNYAGVSPKVMEFIANINKGHISGYGEDVYTAKAKALIKKEFGQQSEIFFVYNGTAANTLALGQMSQSFHSIISTDLSHIIIHEVTAPQTWTGCKFIALPHKDGKITAEQIQDVYDEETFWGRHTALPKVVSISQTTEVGTVYSREEMLEISEVCKKNNMLLHVDGARIANACVALNCSFKEMITDCGVDILSFGGTKNGLMFGEALVFLNEKFAENFEYVQKQGMQLHSKMRFLSGQYIPYLEDNIWRQNALNANKLALLMADELQKIIPGCLAYPAQSNQIFVKFHPQLIEELQKTFHFYVFEPKNNIVRLVTSFDSTEDEVLAFISKVKELL